MLFTAIIYFATVIHTKTDTFANIQSYEALRLINSFTSNFYHT